MTHEQFQSSPLPNIGTVQEHYDMKYKELKLIQEKASDLFFGPPDEEKHHHPLFPREEAWLFDERQVLEVIRQRFGGDHGADLVRVLPCDKEEFYRWCGRKGGMTRSYRKSKSSAANARRSKGTKRNYSQEEIQRRTERLVKYWADRKAKTISATPEADTAQ